MSDIPYVPVLKGRNGEYGALETLPPNQKALLFPILEIPPIPWNYSRNQPDKTIDQHLQKVGANIERAWGRTQPILVDMMWVESDERMADGSHPAKYLFGDVRSRGIHAIPVTGLLRDVEYQRAYRDIIQQDGRGVCIRLLREDVGESDLESQVASLLSDLGTHGNEADLVFDLRTITSEGQTDEVVAMIDSLPTLDSWRSFALCGTGFPADLMGLPPLTMSSIPRREWTLWTDIVSRRSLSRIPSFGDYAIAGPQPSEVDPRIMRPSASIRYTSDQSWLILKGRNLRDYGFGQFHHVSHALVNSSEYSGRNFSWGDGYISKCARRLVGTGNLTTWRKVGTSHHIAFVLQQLSSFSAI